MHKSNDIKNEKMIYWTREELNAWSNAGLIPTTLLVAGKEKELCDFIIKNKQNLYSHYKHDPKEFDCHVLLPPAEEWNKTFELPIVNTKTGQIVKVLEQHKTLDLCEGISLMVKAKELDAWKQETAAIHKLTKEEGKIFKATIDKLSSKKSISRKEIVTIIEEVRKKQKSTKVRQAGHFSDMKLERKFDEIESSTQEKIGADVTIKTFGIKLTPQEDKLLNAIYKLLHEKSENNDISSEAFYAGNHTGEIVPYGGKGQEEMSTFLRIKPTELYQEYLGKNKYSGKEITNVKTTLFGLSDKKFLIQYNRQRKVHNGRKVETLYDRIEDFQSLIKIISYMEGMTDKELKSIDSGDLSVREQKEELIIALNPLLTDQINSKYVEYPPDINQRTMIASGGAMRVTESINDLRDYMLREISAKRYTCTLNEETLINQLRLSAYAKSGRKKLVQERIIGAIEVSKKLGLIINYEIQTGSHGQRKFAFTLNVDFE